MKIIYNNIIPFKGYVAINIFGIIFARKVYKPISKITINHEKIHTEQMKELGFIFFYVWYGIEYLIKLIKYKNHNKAYSLLSFELEAYIHDHNEDYLLKRKHYNWFKFYFN